MKKNCEACTHSVFIDSVINEKKVYVCKEAFYQKTKYDSSKKMNLTTFAPIVYEDDTCFRFEKK